MNRQSWIVGEAAQAHWVQGCAPQVAAEPLQNEHLATALPTGNVSNPAIWKRFKLEGTRAQSQCLGTQLSAPFFFQAACTEQKTLTCILTHRKTAWECTEEWRKTTPVLADRYYQPMPEDKDTRQCGTHFCYGWFFEGNSVYSQNTESDIWGENICEPKQQRFTSDILIYW